MDDIADKIQGLFENEESLNMIKNIASGLMGESSNAETTSPISALSSGGDSLFSSIDAKTLKKISNAYSSSSIKKENTDLIMALKPHLSKKRGEKVDSALNMLRLSKMALAFFEK